MSQYSTPMSGLSPSPSNRPVMRLNNGTVEKVEKEEKPDEAMSEAVLGIFLSTILPPGIMDMQHVNEIISGSKDQKPQGLTLTDSIASQAAMMGISIINPKDALIEGKLGKMKVEEKKSNESPYRASRERAKPRH